MPAPITKYLISALYDFVADHSLPRFHVRFHHPLLVIGPDPKTFDDYVDREGALVLNIHCNACKKIDIRDNGIYLEMACKGKPVDVFAPWHSFIDHFISIDVKTKDEGDMTIQMPIILGKGTLHHTGFPLDGVEEIAVEEKVTKPPFLKIVK